MHVLTTVTPLQNKTVEPGIYFSPHLLAAVRDSKHIDHDVLKRYESVGGVRIDLIGSRHSSNMRDAVWYSCKGCGATFTEEARPAHNCGRQMMGLTRI